MSIHREFLLIFIKIELYNSKIIYVIIKNVIDLYMVCVSQEKRKNPDW